MHGVTAINGLTAISKFIIWLIFLMLAMDNLGVDITALVAGLGIGGLAIALAAQSILGDLFASLTIMIDKPIAIGDYVVVDNFMGNVKAIGIKSTNREELSKNITREVPAGWANSFGMKSWLRSSSW